MSEVEQLRSALADALVVIEDYLAYRHDGDPWTEDARQHGDMKINDYERDGSLTAAKALLTGSGGMSDRTADQERLRFEGDLDKWMKIIGVGISGYQPEAYAAMDAACHELVKSREELLRMVLFLHALRDGEHGDVPRSWKDAINCFLDAPTPSEIGWRQRQGGSEA